MNALESQGALGSTYGVQAVEDNYGDMFYYDSCIVMKNSLTSINPAYIDAELLGDVAFTLTSSGANYVTIYYLIGGFDMYTSYESLGNEVEFNGICYPYFYNAYIALTGADYYEPQSTSWTQSYSIGVGWPASVSVSFSAPSYELISVSTTPYATTPYNFFAFNLTWTFTYDYPSTFSGPTTFVNGFIAGQDGSAPIIPTNYSPGGTYWFYLPFNAEVTAGIQYDAYYDPCWSAWANTAWVVGFVAPSSNTVSINTVYLGHPPQQPNVPSGTWISGYTNHCPSTVNLSGT